jgi:hypothetical protein
MSIYSMLHAGADTGGNLVIGTLAVPLGLTTALTLGGIVALLFGVTLNFALPKVRRLP